MNLKIQKYFFMGFSTLLFCHPLESACIDVPVSMTLPSSTFSSSSVNVGSDSIEVFDSRFQMMRTKTDLSYWCTNQSRRDTTFAYIDSSSNLQELVKESKLKDLVKNETDPNYNFYKRLLKIEDFNTLKDELTQFHLKQVKAQFSKQRVTLDESWLTVCFQQADEFLIKTPNTTEVKAVAFIEGEKKALEDQKITIYSVKNTKEGSVIDKSQPFLEFTSQLLVKKKETLRVMNVSSFAKSKSDPVRTAQVFFNPADDTPDLESFDEGNKRWLANNPSIYDLTKGDRLTFKCGQPER